MKGWMRRHALSYRRRLIDQVLEEHREVYRGIVLDIGGRDRGQFVKPRREVTRWITADIEAKHKPDLVIDVTAMPQVVNASIDLINATELFEHVGAIEKGLDECRRVLRGGGRLLITVPFLYPVHGDPFDWQRWTHTKWQQELTSRGFEIEEWRVLGRYFTVLADMLKRGMEQLPRAVRLGLLFVYPVLDCLVRLDRRPTIRQHPILGNYHGGYFIIARKSVV